MPGSEVRYLQLAHNVWDPVAKRSRVQVVYKFGREEPGTREALERLVASVSRHLDPGRARPAEELEFTESRPLGGTHVLDALWERLGIGPAVSRTAAEQRRLGFSALAGQLEEVNRVHARLITRPKQAGDHPARRERLLVDPPANRTGSFCSASAEYASATPDIRLAACP